MLRRTGDQHTDRYERIQEPGVGAWHADLCRSSSRQRLHSGCGTEEWAADVLSLWYAGGAGVEKRVKVAASIDSVDTCRERNREEIEKSEGACEPLNETFIKSYLIIGI